MDDYDSSDSEYERNPPQPQSSLEMLQSTKQMALTALTSQFANQSITAEQYAAACAALDSINTPRAIREEFLDDCYYGHLNTVVTSLTKHPGLIQAYSVSNYSNALHCAVAGGQVDILDMLLTHGMTDSVLLNHQDEEGWTPVHVSVFDDQLPCLSRLIEAKADLNLSSQHEKLSPLLIAIRLLRVDHVKLLLMTGADPNRVDYQGLTPAHHVMFHCRNTSSESDPEILASILAMLQLLLEHEADFNRADEECGWTPCMTAAWWGQAQILTWLLEHAHVNVNLPDFHGKTPLNLACEQGHVRCVSVLLQHYASLSQVDEQGRSVIFCNYNHCP